MLSSNELARALCRALEIDMKGIRTMTIKLDAFKPVEIQIERFMAPAEGDELVSVVSSYVLADKPTQ
jgi:hypothetical protein